MWFAIVIVAIICVVIIVAVRAALAGQRARHEPQPEAVDPAAAADEFPEPGEPSPRRADGSPPPGSRDDRAQKRAD